MKWILVVMWLYGSPMTPNTVLEFDTLATCEYGKQTIQAHLEAERTRAEEQFKKHNPANTYWGPRPLVICMQK